MSKVDKVNTKRKAKINIYAHEINLTDLKIKNAPKDRFRKELESIAYRGYEVESLKDGRKIVITKPGGKFTFGTIKREDFMVWIFNPTDKTLWLISHKNIFEDLEEKSHKDPKGTIEIINALEKVYNGKEPDDVLRDVKWKDINGEEPEVILKAYKWIWGQEDVNYPDGKGRAMSWEGIKKDEKGNWVKTGSGIVDLRKKLKKF
ncbi:MAG: hypothetical protein AAB584_00730 [Patescibacteria group bacterium]